MRYPDNVSPDKLAQHASDDMLLFTAVLSIFIGIALILTGMLMRSSTEEQGIRKIKDLKNTEKILIGMSQGLSIIPGISRSGTTVAAFLLFKVDNEESFKGSFLISVPAVLGAVGLDILILIFGDDQNYADLSNFGIILSILFAFSCEEFLNLITADCNPQG